MTKINNCKKWKIYQWSYSLIVGYLSFMTFGSFVVEKYCSSSSSSETSSSSSSFSLSDGLCRSSNGKKSSNLLFVVKSSSPSAHSIVYVLLNSLKSVTVHL
eukprot:UN22518